MNRELILLYWDIGAAIVEKQKAAKWGDSVVERLAADLRDEFPEMTGFSGRNVRNMKRIWLEYAAPEFWQQAVAKLESTTNSPSKWQQAVAEITTETERTQFLRQVVAEIPWGHHLLILSKASTPAARLYYIQSTAQLGWSRKVLLNQIKAGAYERSLTEPKTHNFDVALPEHFAEQAGEMMKSRYNLEFLGIAKAIRERDLESRLTEHLQRFILELGYGFCFIGRQHRLVVGQKDYFVDLLFYHRFLNALVAFDLKIGEFEPEHAGKMDFYLNLLNDRERSANDNPSIGIILCAEKNDIEVEYALKSKANPIGVAEYQLQTQLPAELHGKLPTAQQFESAVRRAIANEPPETNE